MAWFNELASKAIGVGWVILVTTAMMPVPILAQMPEQAQRICRNAIVGLAGIPASMLEVSSERSAFNKTIVDVRVTRPLDLGNGASADSHIGTCSFDPFGELINIDTFVYSAQSPSHFKDFGEVPNIGRFIVILRSRRAGKGELLEEGRLRPVTPPGEDIVFPSRTNLYYSTVGRDFKDETAVFPVLINDSQEHWWANCLTKYMGKLNAEGARIMPPIAPNDLTKAVTRLVCS